MEDDDELPFVIDRVGNQSNLSAVPGPDTSKTTVFIRNLPFDITDELLERKFEEIGPVRRAFIVSGKGSQGSKGFGFVVFADEADAQDAIKQIHNSEMSGRKIKVELAKPGGATQQPEPVVGSEEPLAAAAKQPASGGTAVKASCTNGKSLPFPRRRYCKKTPSETNKNVIIIEGISSTTTEKKLSRRMRKYGAIIRLEYPSVESTPSYLTARVVFHQPEPAAKVIRALDKKDMDGSAVRAGYIDIKCARVVIRNLPFNCTQKRIRLLLKQFGSIADVNLPEDSTKGPGCHKGFGFVQFSTVEEAEKAVQAGSIKLGGRLIAIDWALAKSHYQSRNAEGAGEDAENSSDEEENDVEQEAEEDEDDFIGDHDDDDEIEVDSDDEVDEDVEMEESAVVEATKSDLPRISRDVHEGRSVFVRNLPFDVSEDQVRDLFSRFGAVSKVMIVMDKEMNRPKGSGFVQFDSADSASRAVEASRSSHAGPPSKNKPQRAKTTDGGVQLCGRPLDVAIAVDRSKAGQFQESNSQKKKEDRKCSYLAKEGYIKEDSDAAKGLSKIDITMRSKLYKETMKKLDNPNYIMSKFRLSVHNLPNDLDEAKLRSAFIKGIKGNRPDIRPTIKQCIIIRDKQRVDAAGKPRSLRYGFIEFTEHDHAVVGLRAVNNNAMAFGDKSHRPIVMFAVDDVRKLALRTTRLAKNKQKFQVSKLKAEIESDVAAPNKDKADVKPRKDSKTGKLVAKPVKPLKRKQTSDPTHLEPKKSDTQPKTKRARLPTKPKTAVKSADKVRDSTIVKQSQEQDQLKVMMEDYKSKYASPSSFQDRSHLITKRWFE